MNGPAFFLLISFFTCLPFPLIASFGREVPGRTSVESGKDGVYELLKQAESSKEPRKTVELGEEALERLRTFPLDRSLKGRILDLLCGAYLQLGDFSAAEERASQLLDTAGDGENSRLLAHGHRRKGDIAFRRGNYSLALHHYAIALPLYRKLKFNREIADVSFYTGFCYWYSGDSERALEYTLETVKLAKKSNDWTGLGNGYNGLGIIYLNLGKYDQALEYCEQAIKAWKKIGNRVKIAGVLNNIAVVNLKKNEYDRALHFFKQSLAIKEDLGIKTGIALAYNNIGEVYELSNQLDLALEYYDRSFQVRRQMKGTMKLHSNWLNLGRILRKMKHYRRALYSLEKALRESRASNNFRTAKDSVHELSELYSAMGNYQKAVEYYKTYKTMEEQAQGDEIQRKLQEMKLRYENDVKEKEIALLEKDRKMDRLMIEREKSVKLSLALISVLLVIVIVVLYIRNRYRTRLTRQLQDEVDRHKETARKLRAGEATYRALAEQSVVGIVIVQDKKITYVNPRLLDIFGHEARDSLGRSPLDFCHPGDRDMLNALLQQPPDQSEEIDRFIFRGVRTDGNTIYLETHSANFVFSGQPATLATIIDITARKKAEKNLLISKKLEAIGRLTGGIAHDFNNLLSVIIGNIQMVKEDVEQNSTALTKADAIEFASLKASDLVRELQAYAPKG